MCSVFPLLIGHMLQVLAQEKRRVQNHGDRGRRAGEVLDGRAKEESHRLHTRITVKNHKENER